MMKYIGDTSKIKNRNIKYFRLYSDKINNYELLINYSKDCNDFIIATEKEKVNLLHPSDTPY